MTIVLILFDATSSILIPRSDEEMTISGMLHSILKDQAMFVDLDGEKRNKRIYIPEQQNEKPPTTQQNLKKVREVAEQVIKFLQLMNRNGSSIRFLTSRNNVKALGRPRNPVKFFRSRLNF